MTRYSSRTRRAVVRALVLALAAGLTGLACLAAAGRSAAPTNNPELAVRQFADGYGRYSAGRVLRLFEKDAVINLVGLGVTARGRRGIDGLLEYARAAGAELALSGLERRGDTVSCRLRETNNWLRALALDSIAHDARFIFTGSRIARADIRLLPASRSELGHAGLGFGRWVRDNDPAAIEQVLPGGRPDLSAENARLLLELIARWRAAQR